jgi:hypothetical protein
MRITKEIEVANGIQTDAGDVPLGSGGGIKGRVLQMPGEEGIPGTMVRAAKSGGTARSETRTSADGAYELPGLETGLYSLTVPDFNVQAWVGVENLETKEVILRVGAGGINGQVVRVGQGHRSDIHMVLIGYGQGVHRRTTTANDGRFRFDKMSPGRWEVNITSLTNGDWQLKDFVDIGDSGMVDRTFMLPSARMSGQTVDANNAPVPGARVIARLVSATSADSAYLQASAETVSDTNGGFSIDGLAPGSYSVSGSKDGIGQATADGQQIPAAGNPAPVVLRLVPPDGGTLVSVALNMTNSLPVKEAWCYLFSPTGVFEHGRTRDDTGRMTIPDIPPGNYRVQVSALGMSVAEHNVEIRRGETVRYEDVLYESGALRWAFKDSAGTPVANVRCQLVPADPSSIEKPREGVSGPDGMWIVRGLSPGNYSGSATAPSGRAINESITIFARTPVDRATLVE